MQKFVRGASALILVTLCSGTAFAQATRTWVSGVGDDVNPCSRTAPCKTFAGAISKTAAGGVISVLDPGGYGAVTITKAITLDGGGIDGSILGAGTNGVVINAAAADHVLLRNITIYGAGTGLTGLRVINSSGKVTLENVVISGFALGIEHNTAGNLYVYDSFVHNNRSFGAHVRQGRATFDNVRFEANSSDGLRATTGAKVTVRGGVTSGHVNMGFSAFNANTVLVIDGATVAGNAWGIGSQDSATVTVNNATISNNTVLGLYTASSGALLTFGTNRLTGNNAPGAFTGSVAAQ